ncbi:hypothetical protein [Vibrio tritonius]|uniref:hypothetical protein n=1 Tax=Vibrio tritonius TaxID=1435069 RepID=UPI00315DAE7B
MGKFTLVFFISLFLTTGCSAWKWKYGDEKPSISYSRMDKPSDGEMVGTVWGVNPDDTGIYANENGQACMMYAQVFKTRNNKRDISAELAKYKDSIDGFEGKFLNDITEAATLLAKNDESSTFASVMMFNICMLSANGALTNEQVTKLTSEVIGASSNMSSESSVQKSAK